MTEHREWPIAAYLAGELTPHEADLVDQHVMSCDQCWNEVQLARTGQSAAAGAAEPAPEYLRRTVAAAFAGLDPAQPVETLDQPASGRGVRHELQARRGLRVAAAAAVLIVVALGAALTGARLQHSSDAATNSATKTAQGQVLNQALSYYRATMLPGGASILSRPAPDLSALGLHVTAAGAGRLGGQPSVGYAYANAQRNVILVFTGTARFHDPALPTSATGTIRAAGGLTVFAATTHPTLVIGSDAQLVEQVGRRLT